MSIVSLLIGTLIGAVVFGVVIWIIGKLRLGIEVSGFAPAFWAAIVIGFLSNLVNYVLSITGTTLAGWLGAVINLVIAAAILLTAGSWIKGLKVKGWVGAIIAAIFIALVQFLIALLLTSATGMAI